MFDLAKETPWTLLTESEYTDLLAIPSLVLPLPVGATLIEEGERGDSQNFALLILEGRVKITKRTGDKEKLIAVRGRGEIVGETGLLLGMPRTATVVALDPVRVKYLYATDWFAFLYEHRRAMLAVLYATERRLEEATRKFVESSLTIETRFAKTLLELAVKAPERPTLDGVVLDLSQQEIADLMDVSREAIVMSVRNLKGQQVLDTRRGRIVIRDVDALRKIARLS